MASAIKGGDLVGVGGAICVAPETCCEQGCGRPAVEFEGRRAVDPRSSAVVGRCRIHADFDRVYAAWWQALPWDVREEIDGLDSEACQATEEWYAARDARSQRMAGVTAETVRAANRAAVLAATRASDLRTRHGAPARPE